MKNSRAIQCLAVAALALLTGANSVEAARVLWSETPADTVRPERGSDPIEARMRREILARSPDLRLKPASYQRIEVPEPEPQQWIGLREQPADSTVPSAVPASLPRPVFPVSK